jgi:hypothetical protein
VSNVPQPQKSSSTHPMEFLGEVGHANLVLVHVEIVLVSVQYGCTASAKRTISLEIVVHTPNGTPR